MSRKNGTIAAIAKTLMKIWMPYLRLFSVLKKFAVPAAIAAATAITVAYFAVPMGFRNFISSKVALANPFRTPPLKIDDTICTIDEVRQLARLVTATRYHEYLSVTPEREKDDTKPRDREYVFFLKGKVEAGYDLSNLNESDMVVDSRKITLRLPEVKILETYAAPKRYETVHIKGDWTNAEVSELEIKARDTVKQEALESGILKSAEESAVRELTNFFRAIGFKEFVFENLKFGGEAANLDKSKL